MDERSKMRKQESGKLSTVDVADANELTGQDSTLM